MHRVLRHESKCRHMHGHRWEIIITCQAPSLDAIGRVIDFGVIKEIFGKWLDENLDHNAILNREDPILTDLSEEQLKSITMCKHPYVMDGNPTSENLAIHLYEIANRLLEPKDIKCVHIRIYETPNCYADYEENE